MDENNYFPGIRGEIFLVIIIRCKMKFTIEKKLPFRFILLFSLFDACKSEKESRSKYSEEKENRRGE